MSATVDILEFTMPEDFGMLKGAPANDDDLSPEGAFWAVVMGDVEHEEDV